MKNENSVGGALSEEGKTGKQGVKKMEKTRAGEKRNPESLWDFSGGRIRRDRVRIYILLERRRKVAYWWKEYARRLYAARCHEGGCCPEI
jgi:hypothetical protein